MSRKNLFLAAGLIVIFAAGASIYAIMRPRTEYLSSLNRYVIHKRTVLVHNPITIVLTTGRPVPTLVPYEHFSEIELAGISEEDAVALVRRDCPDSKGWIFRVHGRGPRYTYDLRKGQAAITFTAGGRLFDNPNATVSIIESTPVSKAEQTVIEMAKKVGIHLARG